MDADVRGFLLTVGYDVFIFCCAFLFWTYLRTLRGDPTVNYPVTPSSTPLSYSPRDTSREVGGSDPGDDAKPGEVCLERRSDLARVLSQVAPSSYDASGSPSGRRPADYGGSSPFPGTYSPDTLQLQQPLLNAESAGVHFTSDVISFAERPSMATPLSDTPGADSPCQFSKVSVPSTVPSSPSPPGFYTTSTALSPTPSPLHIPPWYPVRWLARFLRKWLWLSLDGFSHLLLLRRSASSAVPPTGASDSRLYLSFLNTSTKLFLYLSVIGLLVVLPLNLSGPSTGLQSFFDRAAAENVATTSVAIWVLYVVCWVYSGVGYYFVYVCWTTAVRLTNPRNVFYSSTTITIPSTRRQKVTAWTTDSAPSSTTDIAAPDSRNDIARRTTGGPQPGMSDYPVGDFPPGAPLSSDSASFSTGRSARFPSSAGLPSSFHPAWFRPELHTLMVSGICRDLASRPVMQADMQGHPARHANTTDVLVAESRYRQCSPSETPVCADGGSAAPGNAGRPCRRPLDYHSEPSGSAAPFLSGTDSAAMELRDHFEALQPGQVVSAHVVLDYSRRLQEEKKLLIARRHLEEADSVRRRHLLGRRQRGTPTDLFESCHSHCSLHDSDTGVGVQGTNATPALNAEEHADAALLHMALEDEEVVAFWRSQYRRQSTEVANACAVRPAHTAGIGFVSMVTKEAVEECLGDPRGVGSHCDWTLHQAPSPQDIIWNNIHISKEMRTVRCMVFNALLILVSVIVVSPVTVLNELSPLIGNLENAFNESSYIRLTITAWLPPLILLALNQLVVPLLVSWVAKGTRHWRRSSEASYILHGNIIYLILNTIIIPLMSLQSIAAVIHTLYQTEIQKWSISLGYLLLSSSGSFAIRYLINCCFLTSSSQMLQIPQLSANGLRRGLLGSEAKLWDFDFGYWYAVNLSIFTLILVFSVVVPLVLPLGALFFALKYRIDRYNFDNGIWNVNVDSGGKVASTACRYMLFAISFMQFIMAGFYLVREDKYLTLAGALLFVTSTVSWVLLLSHSSSLFNRAATSMTTAKFQRHVAGRAAWGGAGAGGSDVIDGGERFAGYYEDEEPGIETPLSFEQLEYLQEAYKHPCEKSRKAAGAALVD